MTQYAPTRKDRLLEHSLRRRIMELIKQRPGVSKGTLRETLDCSWGTIHHHMNLLVREGFVLANQAGRSLRYFPTDMNKRLLESVAVVKRGRARELVSIIMEKPDRNQSELLEHINMTRKILRPHIDRLIGAGLIEEIRKNGCCTYRPTKYLRVVMQHVHASASPETEDAAEEDDVVVGQPHEEEHEDPPQRLQPLLQQ